MENHPIPQDVTGFKFKLIGSMTIKQFLYLLGFGILTTVTFVLQVNIFVKVPLMLLFSLIGIALAFIPIDGRPMDVMLTNFARAIPSENRYIYRKRGVNLVAYELFKIVLKPQAPSTSRPNEVKKSSQDEKRAILLSRLRNSTFRPDESELRFFKNIKAFFEEGGISVTVQKIPDKIQEQAPEKVPMPIINADEENRRIVSPQKFTPPKSDIEKLQRELDEAKQMQEKRVGDQENLAAKIKELEEELAKSLQEKDVLAKKIVEYEVGESKKEEKIFKPSQGEEKQETQNVKYVAPSSTLNAGFPTLPDVPNIVMGIIMDARGKTLPSILVEVVDGNNTPVRAFKTNALGQFASATPLSNGTYKIYFDDPQKQHEFEIIEITLAGEIFNPLEITSVDKREKLRRELFGGQPFA